MVLACPWATRWTFVVYSAVRDSDIVSLWSIVYPSIRRSLFGYSVLETS